MKRQSTGFYIIASLLLVTLLVYALVSLSRMNTRIEEAEEFRDALAAQALTLAVGNASLEYEIEHSTEPDMIARVARDYLGLVLPGEIVFYDIGG